ncbi:molybdopterin cofactor-binding domain-containing protein [Euzebya pacifica]|uniref:molybdopterin cofactor-binding domain-containing protein n=1 Tax=Euzebya pacifica TaxID=1608957 RepID=UPI0030F885D8
MDRRRFLTRILPGTTALVVVGGWTTPATAQLPGFPPVDGLLPDGDGLPGVALDDFYDLGDNLIQAAAPTMTLMRMEITEDGRALFELPRAEVGQGIDTTVAMMIDEELDIGMDNIVVTLSDARPELMFNQITGGSTNTRALYQPVSRMAAAAREAMAQEASARLGVPTSALVVGGGGIAGPDGIAIPYGSLSQATMVLGTPLGSATKPVADHRRLGTFQARTDALAAVTGRKQYAMDLDVVEDPLHCVAVHSPQIRGTLAAFDEAAIRALPGVVDVAAIRSVPTLGIGEAPSYGLSTNPTALIVAGRTFGDALKAEATIKAQGLATWTPGTQAGRGDADHRQDLVAATLPISPDLPGVEAVSGEFEFNHIAHAPLETMTAVAHTTDSSCEVWSAMKIPIPAQEEIAAQLGLPITSVTCHVVTGGGSFGRRLFHEAAAEAAIASRALDRPVKLMWSRQEDMRGDRLRPRTFHRIKVTKALGKAVAFEHRFTSGFTSFSHGFGDAVTSLIGHATPAQYTFAQYIFELMMNQPYDLGLNTQLLNEVDHEINTGSWRAVYTGTGRAAEEIIIDELAASFDTDPLEFRIRNAKDEGLVRCLEWVRDNGGWGNPAPGTAQGIGANSEHRSNMAVMVELAEVEDPYPAPPGARGGPSNYRVTKAVMAFQTGIVMNRAGLEAQMLGHLNDGISSILRASIHIEDGAIQESAFSDFRYARMAHHPPEVLMHVFGSTTAESAEPGGAGETGIAAAAGAVANAYARLTGTAPRTFPINH